MAMVYPTMDSVGFVTTPTTVAERILSDYRATNHGQSVTVGGLRSLQKTLQENAANIERFASKVQEDLTALYAAYLDDTDVSVSYISTEQSDGSENDCVVELQIRVQYRNGAELIELARSLKYDSTGLSRLVELEF